MIADHQEAADEIDQHGPDAGKCTQDHKKPAARHPLADVQTDHPPVRRLIAAVFLFFLSEKLDQKLPAHRKRLIQDPVNLIIAFLGFIGKRPPRLPGSAGRNGKEGNDHDPDQRQDPVLLEHGDHGNHKGDDIGQNARKGVGNNRLHPVDVAGHARDNVPLVIICKKPLGHLLQMAVHLISHVKCDMLRHPGIDIALRKPDEIREESHQKRQKNIAHQSVQVSLQKTLIQDLSGQDRRQQSEKG